MKFGKLIYLSLFIFTILGTTISISNAADVETSAGEIKYQPTSKDIPIYFGTINLSNSGQDTLNFLEDMYSYYKNTPENIRKGGFDLKTFNIAKNKPEIRKTIRDYTKDPLYSKYKGDNNFLGNFNPSDSIKKVNDIKNLLTYIAKENYTYFYNKSGTLITGKKPKIIISYSIPKINPLDTFQSFSPFINLFNKIENNKLQNWIDYKKLNSSYKLYKSKTVSSNFFNSEVNYTFESLQSRDQEGAKYVSAIAACIMYDYAINDGKATTLFISKKTTPLSCFPKDFDKILTNLSYNK